MRTFFLYIYEFARKILLHLQGKFFYVSEENFLYLRGKFFFIFPGKMFLYLLEILLETLNESYRKENIDR